MVVVRSAGGGSSGSDRNPLVRQKTEKTGRLLHEKGATQMGYKFDMYELEARYDARKSFYGKAKVLLFPDGKELWSYDTLVAIYEPDSGEVTLGRLWDYSNTTIRHVKEFPRQQGVNVNTKADIERQFTTAKVAA